jgi:hypothetical protein
MNVLTRCRRVVRLRRSNPTSLAVPSSILIRAIVRVGAAAARPISAAPAGTFGVLRWTTITVGAAALTWSLWSRSAHSAAPFRVFTGPAIRVAARSWTRLAVSSASGRVLVATAITVGATWVLIALGQRVRGAASDGGGEAQTKAQRTKKRTPAYGALRTDVRIAKCARRALDLLGHRGTLRAGFGALVFLYCAPI